MPQRLLSLLALSLCSVSLVAQDKDNVPSVLEGDAIVRRNGVYYNNRPLYAGQNNPDQRYYWVFAGDRPFLQFGGGPNIDGCFLLGFQRSDGTAKWLLDFKSVEARYRPGRMEWVASDEALPGVTISLDALPLGTGLGMAAQARVSGAAAGDRLVWLFGAAHSRWVNHIDAMAADSAHVRYEGFDPAWAAGNGVEVAGGVIRLHQVRGHQGRHTLLACSDAAEIRVADAERWKTPAALLASAGDTRPMACGLTAIVNDQPITWIAHVWPDKEDAAPDVRAEFRAAWDRVEQLSNRVVSKTPDARFDFMVRAATSPADCLWRKAAFGHGCLSAFVDPLLGWRSTLAGVAYGWHDRVLKAGRTFLASQVTGDSYKDQPELAKIVEHNIELDRYEGTLCHPGKDPRFFSKGRLIPNQNSTMYDMQSQFIDALVEDWRFTADPEMEKLLRPALELHLDYLARVFDPDGDGTYESFNNTFLTDTVWYNGGGTPDETAFAWRGHLAARDMARRAGDEAAVKRHEATLDLIRKGFFEKLWVDNQGHPGAYREQGGHQRLHAEAWLPGLYLPLDCPGLMNDEQMASTLHFVEYALEHEPRPTGGVRVWPSNWVPSIWTNRWKAPGDEYHMALGYCLAGMPEGAMEIIKRQHQRRRLRVERAGQSGLYGASCGTDFGDCVAAFVRTVVSGIFGYRPDRPNGVVTIAPQFPATWDHAAFHHPEFKLAYRREGTDERLSVELPPRVGHGIAVALPRHGGQICDAQRPTGSRADPARLRPLDLRGPHAGVEKSRIDCDGGPATAGGCGRVARSRGRRCRRIGCGRRTHHRTSRRAACSGIAQARRGQGERSDRQQRRPSSALGAGRDGPKGPAVPDLRLPGPQPAGRAIRGGEEPAPRAGKRPMDPDRSGGRAQRTGIRTLSAGLRLAASGHDVTASGPGCPRRVERRLRWETASGY